MGQNLVMEKHQRLRTARERAGFPHASDAARRMGMSTATYAAHENGSRDYSDAAARKYGRLYHVSPAWLMWGEEDEPTDANDKFLAPTHLRLSTVPVPNGTLPVLGRVAAGMWLEVDVLDNSDEPRATIPVPPDPALPQGARFGLIVAGTSINRIAQDGEVLVCTSLAETGIQIEHNDLVIVERLKGQDGLREVTAKRFCQFADRIELHPESNDPRWQEPIVLRHAENDGHQDVKIIARVEWVYKPVRLAAR